MSVVGIKAFFVLSAALAWGAVSADDIFGADDGLDFVDHHAVMARRLNATSSTNSTNSSTACKQSNDFMYSKCQGEGTAFKCCTPEEACVVVNVKSGTTTVKDNVCTKKRKLTGMRLVRVICLPCFVLIAGFSALAIMLKRFGWKRPGTLITAAVIVISWPLAISQMYTFYLWAVFLAFLVAAACSGFVDAPWYAFRLLWLVEVFQVIAIFGDYETFFVPLWGNSGATAANMLGDTRLDQSSCASFYQNYFEVLPLEKNAVNANPIAAYWGLCTTEWLAFVHCAVIFQGLFWMWAAVKTAPMLLSSDPSKFFGPARETAVKETAAEETAAKETGAKETAV